MSDHPSAAALAPPQKLNGIVADTHPSIARGFIAPLLFTTAKGSSIRVPGARSGQLELRNQRAVLQAGANAPKVGRAPGAPRPTQGRYVSSPIEWAPRILSLQHERPKEHVRWLANADTLDPAVAAAMEAEDKQEIATMLNSGPQLQRERLASEQFFGTDHAGTGLSFDFADVSDAGATYGNPDGLTFSDREFPIIDFLAHCAKVLMKRVGGAGGGKFLDVTVGEDLATKLESNYQLLGITTVAIGAGASGIAAVDKDPRLTADMLKQRIEGLSYVKAFHRGGAVADISLPGATQNNQFVWPGAMWVGVLGNALPRLAAGSTSLIKVYDTSVLEVIHKDGEFRAKLDEDELNYKAWAEVDLGYTVVNGDFGLTWFNA
jgi:hypothetical protein